MNKTIKQYIGCFGVLLGLICLTACSEEGGGTIDPTPEPIPEEDPMLESVRLSIGASGSVETRAYGGDENAVEGEFIHTLRVFIVNEGGVIEKAIMANDLLEADDKALAEAGNLTLFTTTVDVEPGRKTIYAFANMNKANLVGETETETNPTTMESVLDGLEEGETWPSNEMSAYVIADPASDINDNLKEVAMDGGGTEWRPDATKGYFIPMSVEQEVDLTTSGQNVEILLVRLVSKVKASIMNRQGNTVSIFNIKMETFHKNVALFEDRTFDDVGSMTYEKSYSESPIEVPTNLESAMELPVFYINETVKTVNNPFTITLTIDREEMSGETQTTSIPRNHVLPLALSLSNVNLELDITAQVAPIGGYPVTVSLSDPSLTDIYHINLPEGCTFAMTGVFKPSFGDDITANFTVKLPDGSATDVVIIDTNTESAGAETIEGHVTALSGQSATLDYVANATGSALRSTGSLVIHTVALQDQGTKYPEYNTVGTRAVEWLTTPQWYEPIHLTTQEAGKE